MKKVIYLTLLLVTVSIINIFGQHPHYVSNEAKSLKETKREERKKKEH